MKIGDRVCIEPFDDPEWDKAEKVDEESEYYWLDTRVYRYKDFLIPNNKGGKFVKRYKPSIAKLVAERTGYKLTPVGRFSDEPCKCFERRTDE